MAKLIIAIGPARTGKTYHGNIWQEASPKSRVVIDGSESEIRHAIKRLDDGYDVWLNLNLKEVPPILRPENLPGHSVEVKKFNRVWQG